MSDLNINPGVEMRDAERELHNFRVRLGIASTFVLMMFGLLFARFCYLQLFMHDHYHTLAEANRISILPIVPNRGIIVDRNGIVLATNYSAYTLEITPSRIDNLDNTIEELATLVEITPRDRRRFKKLLEESKRFESLPIRTRLSDEEIARFAAHRYRFPGVDVRARLFREYPQGEHFSHVIGHIGRISQKDLDRLDADGRLSNYRGTDYIGKTGLEYSYEQHLHGTTGVEQVEVDSGGRAVRSLSRTPPISGSNLVLKLDARLQEVVFRAFGDRRGALVAIEPSSGGVLAFVSKPGFDPNLFVDGIDPQNWNELNTSPDKPMVNRAMNGTYPPGSTFKPFMALAALFYGKRTPSQAISDPGFFNFGGHHFRDDKPGGHGAVDMYKSIVQSCDTYYYQLAADMQIDLISNFMGMLGFGSRTGIDIAGESEGVLPSREWKRKRFRKPEQQKWYAGETISIGIGQGYNAYTPIQLAQALATVLNGGTMYKPHLVSHIDNLRTNARREIAPEVVRTVPFKPQNVEFIKRAMAGVTKEGTAARAFQGAEYTSGGKTGTAQVIAIKQNEKYDEKRVAEQFRDHSLFIAFAPLDSPKIALAVVVENGGFGARAAAPLARTVLDYFMLGKLPPGMAPEDDAAEQAESD